MIVFLLLRASKKGFNEPIGCTPCGAPRPLPCRGTLRAGRFVRKLKIAVSDYVCFQESQSDC